MIREWLTVVNWHKNIATLRFNRNTSCNGCQESQDCGIKALNNLVPFSLQNNEIKIAIGEPLIAGQQVELGINESGLITSAFLVYCVPLLFIFAGVCVTQYVLPNNNLSTLAGILVGMFIGFFIAKMWAKRLEVKMRSGLVVLAIKPIIEK